jgi:hypothetical protein
MTPTTMAGYGSISPPPITVYNDDDKQDGHADLSMYSKRRNWKVYAILILVLVVGAAIAAVQTSFFFPDHQMSKAAHLSDNVEMFYGQTLDHFGPASTETWSQRYYQSKKYFKGPGHPIFVVMTGEDATDAGLLYPFVHEHLARIFGGYTIQIEHRFYGQSQPLEGFNHNSHYRLPTNDELKQFMAPHQAMADAAQLIRHKQESYGCNIKDKTSKHYCPVVTVGGSFPGFLATMMRLVHADVVDIAYASSAPLHLYSQTAGPNAYFEKITKLAEEASPGCAAAVKSTLHGLKTRLSTSPVDEPIFSEVAKDLDICVKHIPHYIQTDTVFLQELMMIVAMGFADFNMGYYPPNQDSDFYQSCKIFQNDDWSVEQRVGKFLQKMKEDDDDDDDGYKSSKTKNKHETACFDMRSQLPSGPNATISGADWSGVGGGPSGFSWDFQTCDPFVVKAGFSAKSMFPPRPWTLEWLTDHCQSRFDVTPEPLRLVEEWAFDDLVSAGASRILFTNGLNDGWSVASILEDVSDTIRVLNFPNGGHHSDLSHVGPSPADTEDIREGYQQIIGIIGEYLELVRSDATDVAGS